MLRATTRPDLDQALADLQAGARRWVDVPARTKAALLIEVREAVARLAQTWATAAAQAKGIAGTPLEGEEWISGPWATLYACNRYIATLEQIAQSGAPILAPERISIRPDGQVVASVFPVDGWDRLLLNGIHAEVRMRAHVTLDRFPQTLGTWYQDRAPVPRIALVLGAGNIASIPPLDVLYKLVADGCVCILKMNPINAYLTPIFSQAFAPLIRDGYLRIVEGGAEVGRYLCEHSLVDEIHITGSDQTHDAIVWGTGDDARTRRANATPRLAKPITSELGNVSPTIVLGGRWSQADYRFQAEQIVTQKLHNDGFNCIAAQVLIVPRDWDGTPHLLAAIDDCILRLKPRPGYYPGAQKRRDTLAAAHGDARVYDAPRHGYVARTLLHVESDDDLALHMEAFAPVLAVVQLEGDTSTYLRAAVEYANARLWGTLGANLVIHPRTMREHATALDDAIAQLRYGCVAVNTWTGVGYFIAEATWGAFPGNTPQAISSGIGVVHNTHLFSQAEKSVVYGPFAPFPRSLFGYGGALLPKPPWFVTHRNAAKVGQALCNFEAHKTLSGALKIALLAMTG